MALLVRDRSHRVDDMDNTVEEWWAAVSTVLKTEMAAHRPRLSQGDLAARVGISRETMSNYLTGKREMPIPVIYRMADELGLTVQWILDEADRRLARGR